MDMNKLPIAKRVQILSMLCEGMSMRAVSRLCDVSFNTIAKMLADAGKVCMTFHDDKVRGLTCKRVQVDEIWSFTYAKQKNVAAAKAAPEGAGETWTWTAIDADTKLIAAWFVGSRDAQSANAFLEDLASRLKHRIQLTSDGHGCYKEAVYTAFDTEVDYAQLIKIYGGGRPEGYEGRYSPDDCTGIKKTRMWGNPDEAHISTSYIERSNLTMRMHNRRFTRLTNAFSKRFESHVHMVAIYTMFYNYLRIHKTLRVTPAMAAGISDRVWDMADIVALMDEVAPKPGRPKTYKKRVAA